ncbi:sulfite exporter TauE/SafE family protein [Xanthomonas populi]|uniref:Probable membrane transporter protein n=1 Tax=Xanthomonas populi TaxID=53414 RepID=A0A2S7ELH5_9XANT|nr:sulfite exporter TauE/SafE family protein [Xanthomonas populi]PPU91093.1 hypothetical protein XpopCFBP1817_15475 [Xanthomonas populi]
MTTLQYLLGTLSGTAVGFTLGLVGGGGSILAVPLMVYLVGVEDPHVAIGTSAIAVAANALIGLSNHARKHNVKWPCAAMFAAAGVGGAWIGAIFGKAMDGQQLLALFSLLMLVVATLMARSRGQHGDPGAVLNRSNAPKLIASGTATGLLSGFFGIGGGFLVVPGLMASTGMPILFAVGSSLVAVVSFGLTTAISYASSGLIAWPLAAAFIAGGALGSVLGSRTATQLADRKGALNLILAGLISVVALYMLSRAMIALG